MGPMTLSRIRFTGKVPFTPLACFPSLALSCALSAPGAAHVDVTFASGRRRPCSERRTAFGKRCGYVSTSRLRSSVASYLF